jgi:hypothetical protein
MNKMLRGEVIDLSSKNKYNVSFFDDDSIDVVRQKVGAAIDIHPDRLHILVGLKLPADYYSRDPRHWEALFERLSYNNDPLEQDIFSDYQLQYRTPNTAVPFRAYDKAEWMSKPEALQSIFEPASEFLEYRILGVEEPRSYILPLSNLSSTLVSRITSVKLPIPDNTKLFNSFYEGDQFVRFLVRPYDELAESGAPVYYPLLRSSTPSKMTEEAIRLLLKTSKALDDLLKLKVPQPSEVSIIRTRVYIPWVDTDFGAAIRTRFEQIFYGITVSKEVPCISLFTSKDQVSRHKFFTEEPKNKQPFIDMSLWTSWWSVKPARNIPSLILFRGKSKHYFDRITITAGDMVIATHRPEGNTETVEQIQRQVADWLSGFDAIMPFLAESDLYKTRWELQDISYLAKYSDKLEDFDLLRFNCISSIFDIADKTKSQFSLMRTDHTNNGLSAVEVKILQMMKDASGSLSSEAVSTELSVTTQTARELIQHVQTRIDEDPRIGEKAFRGYPTMRLGPDYVIVSSISNIEKSLQYSNLLRYILSNPDSDDLNRICPKRAERVSAESAIVSTEPLEVDAALEEEYSDLFAFLEQEETVESESVAETVETVSQRISTEQKQGTTYNYFKSRLQKFDPVTFDPTGSQYPKKCEQKHQPIILSDVDIKRLDGTPYDVKNGKLADDRIVDLQDPDGTVVCPDYWCMRDQIPLSDDQLDRSDGDIKCPVCRGKLQTRTTDNPRDFPLIKRETGFIYPGYVDYKSPRNGRPMPCCFKKSRSKKNDKTEKTTEDKYYVLGVEKAAKPERIAFLPISILNSLRINEKYESFKDGGVRRLMSPNKGFFRTGLGHPSENLPKYLGLKAKIPSPRESVDTVLKCSFLHTWKRVGTAHLDSIENDLKKTNNDPLVQTELAKLISGIDHAFHKKELTTLEELEYTTLALQCDVFRIFTDSSTLGCMFYAPMVRPRSRAIIVLQTEDEIDVLAYTERKTRGFEFRCNIYESPFTRDTYVELEKLRNQSCKLRIPSYNDALLAIQQLLPLVEADDYQIILDPYNRGQALYVPGRLILPFQSIPLPDVLQSKISGYKEVTNENLPEYESMKVLLQTAAKVSNGFAYKEDLFNNTHQKVEILLESGLRIPIKPVQAEPHEASEVIETVRELGESELVFGKESTELKQEQREISYSAEIYEFLLFQLTKDLEVDYKELNHVLRDVSPKLPNVQPLLHKWFEETTQFVDIKEPKQFLSKIREPCNDSCDGELCGWDGDTCKVQINSGVKKEKLFHRLLSTLVENSKIRSMVLDGRTTPFFSTILYLELPHELIVTDYELPA